MFNLNRISVPVSRYCCIIIWVFLLPRSARLEITSARELQPLYDDFESSPDKLVEKRVGEQISPDMVMHPKPEYFRGEFIDGKTPPPPLPKHEYIEKGSSDTGVTEGISEQEKRPTNQPVNDAEQTTLRNDQLEQAQRTDDTHRNETEIVTENTTIEPVQSAQPTPTPTDSPVQQEQDPPSAQQQNSTLPQSEP